MASGPLTSGAFAVWLDVQATYSLWLTDEHTIMLNIQGKERKNLFIFCYTFQHVNVLWIM